MWPYQHWKRAMHVTEIIRDLLKQNRIAILELRFRIHPYKTSIR